MVLHGFGAGHCPASLAIAFSYVPIFTTANIGYGNYNAFVAKVTTRGWHGVQARASYTYSKALDNASSAGAPLIPGPLMTQALALQYYGIGNPISLRAWVATMARSSLRREFSVRAQSRRISRRLPGF